MKVEINEEKLEKITEKFDESPEDIIDYILDNFIQADSFVNTTRHSLRQALFRHFEYLRVGKEIESEIRSLFGEYDYRLEECGFDFESKVFWFSMYVSIDEKKIDIDTIHFQINENGTVQIAFKKLLDNIPDFEKLEEAVSAAKQEMTNCFMDNDFADVEFEGVDEDSIDIKITIRDSHAKHLPKLEQCDRVITILEHSFRKTLKK